MKKIDKHLLGMGLMYWISPRCSRMVLGNLLKSLMDWDHSNSTVISEFTMYLCTYVWIHICWRRYVNMHIYYIICIGFSFGEFLLIQSNMKWYLKRTESKTCSLKGNIFNQQGMQKSYVVAVLLKINYATSSCIPRALSLRSICPT